MCCRGLLWPANPPYLKGFPFSALPSVAPYCVPGGKSGIRSTWIAHLQISCNPDARQGKSRLVLCGSRSRDVLRAVGEFTPDGFRHLGYAESTYYSYSGGLQSANRSAQGRRPLAYWLHLWVRFVALSVARSKLLCEPPALRLPERRWSRRLYDMNRYETMRANR